MKIDFITPTSAQYPTLLEIWERSVRATHHFLNETEIQSIREEVRIGMPEMELIAAVDEHQRMLGFMALDGQRLEMLFIDANCRGQGIGHQLLACAKRLKGNLQLDVNEQNPSALAFYQSQGFVIRGRSELDGSGRPFPLLHMVATVNN